MSEPVALSTTPQREFLSAMMLVIRQQVEQAEQLLKVQRELTTLLRTEKERAAEAVQAFEKQADQFVDQVERRNTLERNARIASKRFLRAIRDSVAAAKRRDSAHEAYDLTCRMAIDHVERYPDEYPDDTPPVEAYED